jgi:hypothetical protein
LRASWLQSVVKCLAASWCLVLPRLPSLPRCSSWTRPVPTMLSTCSTARRLVFDLYLPTPHTNPAQADGRILYVYLKEGGPSQSIHSATPRIASPVVIAQPEPVQEQGAEDTMEIEQPYPTEPSPLPPHEPSPRPAYNNSRSRDGRASYREDYDRGGNRQAEPEYQDGRYGFNGQRYNEPRYDERRPRYRDDGREGRMYSDDVMRGGSRRGGGGRGGGRYRG